MLSWDDLRVLLQIARAGSAGRAAARLGVHPATVFRRLNAAERNIGVRLFERRPSGYVATAAGEELLAVAEPIEQEVAELERRIAGRDTRPSGTVRLTTTDTLLFRLLTPHLASFRRSCPEIDLHVVVSNRFLDLTRHDADIAIRPTLSPGGTLVGRRISAIASAVYGRDGEPADGAPPHPADREWVVPDESLAQLPARQWLAERGAARRPVYRVNTLVGALEAAKAGIGLAVLPCFMGDAEPGLRRLGPPVPELVSELWLLTHEDMRRVARVRALIDFLADALRGERPLLEGRRPHVAPVNGS